MNRQRDEVLSVKLCCAGIIICNVVMVICLMYHFIHTSYMDDNTTNIRHYFTYAAVCVVSIGLVYFIERGHRLSWILSVIITVVGIVDTALEFHNTITFIIGLIALAVSLALLLFPPVCINCRVPVLKRMPWIKS